MLFENTCDCSKSSLTLKISLVTKPINSANISFHWDYVNFSVLKGVKGCFFFFFLNYFKRYPSVTPWSVQILFRTTSSECYIRELLFLITLSPRCVVFIKPSTIESEKKENTKRQKYKDTIGENCKKLKVTKGLHYQCSGLVIYKEKNNNKVISSTETIENSCRKS